MSIGRKAVALGLLSSLFSSTTYLVNSLLAVDGQSWMWSGALRYIFMLPPLLLLVCIRGKLKDTLLEIARKPLSWLLWSNVAFSLFYFSLAYAAAYGPAWLVAGSFQFTILAGALMSPLFPAQDKDGNMLKSGKIPVHLFPAFGVILVGVFLLQLKNISSGTSDGLMFIVPVLISATAYPLGNRKMLQVVDNRLSTIERVFGMTLCSMPICIIFGIIAFVTAGPPSTTQLLGTAVVAMVSGLCATILLFQATKMVQHTPQWIAIVESTQCGEVVFSLLGSVILLGENLPEFAGIIGLTLIVVGMVANSLSAQKRSLKDIADR